MPRNSDKTSLNAITSRLSLEREDALQTTAHQESDEEKITSEDMVCLPFKKRIIKNITNENSAPSTQSEITFPNSLITLATATETVTETEIETETTTLSVVDSPSKSLKRKADSVFAEKIAREPVSPNEKRRVRTNATSVDDDNFLGMQEITVKVKHNKSLWKFVYHRKGNEIFFNDIAVAQLLGVNQSTLRGRLVQLAKEHPNGRVSGKEEGFAYCFNTASLVNEAIFSWPKEGFCFHVNLDQTREILKAAQIPFYNVDNYLQLDTDIPISTTTISTSTKRKREPSPAEFDEQGYLMQDLSPVSSPVTPTPQTETELELEQFIFDISAHVLLQLNADYVQLIAERPRAA